LKVQVSWTGHYEYKMLDHNGIVGFHQQVKNFMFANGFSGHGLQQSPAVGGRCRSSSSTAPFRR